MKGQNNSAKEVCIRNGTKAYQTDFFGINTQLLTTGCGSIINYSYKLDVKIIQS